MNNRKRARAIIEEVLNFALNRHVHLLSDAGYLDERKHGRDCGYQEGEPRPALKLKHELIEEICRRFEPSVADYLEHPREQFWPVHDEQAVEAQMRKNFPGNGP